MLLKFGGIARKLRNKCANKANRGLN